MAAYQFLTDQDKSDIVARVIASRPDPNAELKAREAADQAVLAAEAAKLPPPAVAAAAVAGA